MPSDLYHSSCLTTYSHHLPGQVHLIVPPEVLWKHIYAHLNWPILGFSEASFHGNQKDR